MVMPPMWQVTPLGVVAVLVGIAYEVGMRRLAERQTPEHRYRTSLRSLCFYAALLILIAVVSGPLERWGMDWLSVHMVVHIVEMLYLPPLLIAGAPWVPLVYALPVSLRRKVLSAYYRSGSWRWLRRLGSVVTHPVVAVLLFNTVMVLWHVPVIFDWASFHDWVMNWLMGPSFIVTGLLFWRVILGSHPFPPRGSTGVQVAAIVVTAFEMLVLAMSMSIFTKAPWYSMNILMQGRTAALRDQHWAAAILWVCGDFWAVPALLVIGRRLQATGGGISEAFERALGRA